MPSVPVTAVEMILGNLDGPGISRIYMAQVKDGEVMETDVMDNAVVGGAMTNLSGRMGEN